MNAQFHTPSFGDEVFDLSDVEPLHSMQVANQSSTNNVSHITSNFNDGTTKQADDNREPAKPVSAYGLFFRDTVSAIKAQNPGASFDDISKIVSSMWQVLDPVHKNVYNKKNELAKKEYLKQLTAYRNSQVHLSERDDTSSNTFHQMSPGTQQDVTSKSPQITSRPAVFTIPRSGQGSAAVSNDQASPGGQGNTLYSNNVNPQAATENTFGQTASDATPYQICIRENCNKRAIVNPDWEDEYCSNECVVIHCRNVFNQWIKSNLDSQA